MSRRKCMSNKRSIVNIPVGEVYTPTINKDGFHCIDGPGDGLGYYAHTLNPGLSCDSKEEAEAIANWANVMFQKGQVFAADTLKSALMIDINKVPCRPNIEITEEGGTFNVSVYEKSFSLFTVEQASRFAKIMNIAFKAGESIRTRHVRSLLHFHDGVFE